MKVKIITLMFLTFTFISYSQTDDFICGYDNDVNDNFNQVGNFSHSTDPDVLYAKDPKVFNVFFWQVNKFGGLFGDDPNQHIDITEEEVLSAIANLNIEFNPYNLFFKYRGLGQFDSPEIVYLEEPIGGFCHKIEDDQGNYSVDENGFNTIDNLCQIGQLYDYATDNGYMTDENINIFIPHGTLTFGATGSSSTPRMIIKREHFNTEIMIHEMGHVLYLKHTHRYYRDLSDPLDEDDNYTACEHVTRDPLNLDGSINDEYNAELAGDLIIDTAAVPDFRIEHYWALLEDGATQEEADDFNFHEFIDSDCVYTGDGESCLKNSYEIYDLDSNNIMSYTPNNCKNTFTIGQAIRMHEIVELWPGNYNTTLAELSDLFEPYSGAYPGYYPHPEPWQQPLFQPGFEYYFIKCNGEFPQPADYGELFYYDINEVLLFADTDESDYQSIAHPNHSAILIKHQQGNFLGNAEKCYNNWNSPPVIGGVIVKFNDNIFNTNVTITPQDSTSINNQYLIDNLESGLYKIDKNYEDGSTEETVIYKENN